MLFSFNTIPTNTLYVSFNIYFSVYNIHPSVIMPTRILESGLPHTAANKALHQR